jgi:hypothetical protein
MLVEHRLQCGVDIVGRDRLQPDRPATRQLFRMTQQAFSVRNVSRGFRRQLDSRARTCGLGRKAFRDEGAPQRRAIWNLREVESLSEQEFGEAREGLLGVSSAHQGVFVIAARRRQKPQDTIAVVSQRQQSDQLTVQANADDVRVDVRCCLDERLMPKWM